MKKLLINLIGFYQTYLSFDKGFFSVFAPGGSCRFELSCSEYTKQEIAKQGVIKGIIAGVKRIWSCR